MKRFIILFILFWPGKLLCQFGVNFHQSNIPFVGVNYEFKDRLRPELRIGTDSFLSDISAELVVTYDILNKEDYEVYVGLGIRGGDDYTGVPVPLGINIYPFPMKNFGFHIELSPILSDDSILRGSWGIRYRFKKSE